MSKLWIKQSRKKRKLDIIRLLNSIRSRKNYWQEFLSSPFFDKFLPQFRTGLVGQELRMRYLDEPGYFIVTDNMTLRIVDGHLAIRRDFEMR